MKTLYEILEVSEGASKEIIEKAYKVLAKRYHPDLQNENDKLKAEDMMKKINEAYDILSNDEKRKKYDTELLKKRQNTTSTQVQEQYSSQKTNSAAEAKSKVVDEYIKKQEELQKEMQEQYQQKYQNAYESYLRSLGYKIKYKWTWKRIKELLKTLLIVLIIIVVLWFFPPTHNLIIKFYESNTILQVIVDVIGKIFKGTWNAICSIFGSK